MVKCKSLSTFDSNRCPHLIPNKTMYFSSNFSLQTDNVANVVFQAMGSFLESQIRLNVWSFNGNSPRTNLTFSLVKDNAGCKKRNASPTLLSPLLQHDCPLLVPMHRQLYPWIFKSLHQHHCEHLKLATLPLLKTNNTFWSSCLYCASTALRHCFIIPNWCTQL